MTKCIIATFAMFIFVGSAAAALDVKDYPDKWQCAYRPGGTNAWIYGETTRWKPDALSTALQACRAQGGNCVFLGCFKRQD